MGKTTFVEGDRAKLRAPQSPVRVALFDECELVASGVTAMLHPHRARIRLVQLGPDRVHPDDVDVVLLDPAGGPRRPVDPHTVASLDPVAVLLYSWRERRELRQLTSVPGVAGHLHKSASADELVTALEAARRHEDRIRSRRGVDAPALDDHIPHAPLSGRELEILTMIALGLTNAEIVDTLLLSPNTVKTYIRTAYRKIGVRTRSQAVAWWMQRDRDLDAADSWTA